MPASATMTKSPASAMMTQVTKTGVLSAKADVFAFATVLYELLARRIVNPAESSPQGLHAYADQVMQVCTPVALHDCKHTHGGRCGSGCGVKSAALRVAVAQGVG